MKLDRPSTSNSSAIRTYLSAAFLELARWSILEVSGSQSMARAEACYAIWQDGKLSLESAAYDVEETVEKLRRLSLSAAVFEDLAFVLRNGCIPAAQADSTALPPQVP